MALRAIRRSLCLEPDISGPSESLYRLEDSPRALLKLSMLATESSDAAAVVCASLWNRLSPGHAGTAEDPGIDDTTLRIAKSDTDLALAAFFYLADSGRVGQAWQVLAEAARKGAGIQSPHPKRALYRRGFRRPVRSSLRRRRIALPHRGSDRVRLRRCRGVGALRRP